MALHISEARLRQLQKPPGRRKPRPARAPRLSEHDEQVRVIQWADEQARIEQALLNLFGVPNAGQRHVLVGVKMKAEGLKKGVPDLFLDVPRGRFHGLRIEMKIYPNTPTSDQEDWIQRLTAYGYCVVVCYGAESAIKTIEHYLALGDFQQKEQV